MASRGFRQQEVGFCARVKTWSEEVFRESPDLPFGRAEIEEYVYGGLKRYDLRFYSKGNEVVICGEVRLPGTARGQSPYNDELVWDAYEKADRANCRYFFTWNVNTLVLFDRQLWDVPMIDRRVREWGLNLQLSAPQQAFLPEVATHIREKFLPQFFSEFGEILEGRIPEWGMPPDEIFIKALESHLEWPVSLTRDWLATETERRSSFRDRLAEWMARDQEWSFVRSNPEEWREILHRAASTLCYVLANRLIFYSAVRARFPELPPLQIPARLRDGAKAYRYLQDRFYEAVEATGDYEPIFYAHETERDWISPLVFRPESAIFAWSGLLRSINQFDFSSIPYDIVGRIFQRLIGPEERHKFGQYYTNEDVVDLINAFCVRRPDSKILDPACGSGSFLVRAYQRKGYLDPTLPHRKRIADIYGCDISLFAAHLATLNLAAREIQEEENYPRIARRNFFEIEESQPFCQLPNGAGDSEKSGRDILLPALDAVIGNPPYLREGLIPRKGQKGVIKTQTKEYLKGIVNRAWSDFAPDGRSDLHCYFWPAASRFLKPGGYFGFVTSSNWLDAGYGFPFQGWLLRHFKILAIIEPADEPWFEDARVRTCATILQLCEEESERFANIVRFVRLKHRLGDILDDRPDEQSRQLAAERLRNVIEKQTTDLFDHPDLRIICRSQQQLWEEGLVIGEILRRPGADASDMAEVEDEDDGENELRQVEEENRDSFHLSAGQYGGGKWGRYVRAPDLYFHIMRRFGAQFIHLADIVDIRYGVKSGCDKFFMPKDITEEALAAYNNDRIFQKRFGCKRSDVEAGILKLIEAGDKSVHPIENQYIEPEIHNLRMVVRPRITAKNTRRVILLVNEPLSALRKSWVGRYLQYGTRTTFASKKSKAVPVPQRKTCSARNPWYDLTQAGRGFAFWPKATQYGHIVVANEDNLICNCRVYYMEPLGGRETLDSEVFTAILNSTLVAFWKQFYGRPTGVEGAYDVMVADARIMEVPDPRKAPESLLGRIKSAWARLSARDFGYFVEDEFLSCRSLERARLLASRPLTLPKELEQADRRELDDAVLELIGVNQPAERAELLSRLYEETARYFRQVRVVEIEKMEQRARGDKDRLSATDLANDVYDDTYKDLPSLVQWLSSLTPNRVFAIPDGPPKLPPANDMYDSKTVFFGKKEQIGRVECPSRILAELVERVALLGVRGRITLPYTEERAGAALSEIESKVASVREMFDQAVETRTADPKLAMDTVDLLMRWFVMGKGK